VQDTGVVEVAALGRALQTSAALLHQREQERNEHLARSEAAREEAEAANRLKDQFLSTLSHELRTPLTAILGWASLLRQSQTESQTQRQGGASAGSNSAAGDDGMAANAVETIERNARALAVLVDDLLDMSRINTGKMQLESQQVDLRRTICNAVESVQPAATAKEITIQVKVSDTGSVWGDPHRLQQVLWNLLSNAVKFTPEKGKVVVCLAQQEAEVVIEIRDSGVGIPADVLPHIFDRFRQADGSSTRHFGGLGIGLALVRQLIDLHGGTVQAASAGEGEGSTFTITLPVATPDGGQ
jgi:signal transduction histidine kinase